jgi:transposase
MKNKEVIGVDVSKNTLDIVIKSTREHLRISNNENGYIELNEHMQSIGISFKNCLVAMEHTGMYSHPFEKFLKREAISYWKIAALQIKRSSGIIRGKSDKIDATMIANYAASHPDQVRIESGTEVIQKLQNLLGLREKMVDQRKGYEVSLKEQKHCFALSTESIIVKTQEKIIQVLKEEIRNIDKEINDTIALDVSVKKNFELLQSITGIGFVIGAWMIVWTGNFTKFLDSRKFACYVGIAPFEYSSGTSILKRSKVSHLANKKAKSLLDMGARSAMVWDPEMKLYYQRRIQEGKNEKSTRNIIRNKLVQRMFAVVKRQSKYEKLFTNAA